MRSSIFIVLATLFALTSRGQSTEKIYLSGTGSDRPVNWSFYCTENRNSGHWTSIPVPSNWELQGFGKYNYGLDKDSMRGNEKGLYRFEFTVPKEWKGKTVNIVFDGSMTDTEVRINGKSAGPLHQGAFYRFKYDISGLLRYAGRNLLEVTVSKTSSNNSVNMAERHCDFWIFGGIFRPVFLEALPAQHIGTLAIDAKADGRFTAAVKLAGIAGADKLTVQLLAANATKFGVPFTADIHWGDTLATIKTIIPTPLTWSSEAPNLYTAVFTLSSKGKPLHIVDQKFGFRTVELRERDGIYVNGVKIKFRGICRHSFWPATGRALSRSISILDVNMIKDMNMNAVRMSHYPPDDHFLDVCDSLGLFVLDELTGWHHAYDTQVGSTLVHEMIEKDVNHPSIVIWDNGNEGGFNFDLDPLFDRLDIQQRPLIHPWAKFRHTDTQHYINYDYGNGTNQHGHEIVFPTEFLHGLYDGGMGAGLEDYWEAMWDNPLSAGGFLWDFSDEAVVRTDRGGELDTDGDHGPDGILGPYREKEGSYYAVKEIWSPVKMEHREITEAFDGRLTVHNRFFYTNLDRCHFIWRLTPTKGPWEPATPGISGELSAPDVRPGQQGNLMIPLPPDWRQYDILSVTARDPYGREIYTWSWPIRLPVEIANRIVDTNELSIAPTSHPHPDSANGAHSSALGSNPITNGPGSFARVMAGDTTITLSANGISAIFGKSTGLLRGVQNQHGKIPFTDGPTLAAGAGGIYKLEQRQQGSNEVLEASYAKQSLIRRLKWTMYPSGWLKMEIEYFAPDYEFSLLGVNFSYPEKGHDSVKAVRWLGNGPYRVWKNRMEGVTLGVWENAYNNTITGQGQPVYPEFKGYFSNFYWMRLETAGQPITVVCASEDVYLRLFTPPDPFKTYNVAPPFPDGNISFMQGIPPIGTKSQKPERMGPSGQKNIYYDFNRSADHAKSITLYFDFSGK